VAANQRSRVSAALWVAALLLTLVLAVFQRLTGPSHPVRGNTVLAGGEAVSYRLPRSNEGRPELRVAIPSAGTAPGLNGVATRLASHSAARR
jgi:hypothetical protein